MAEQLVISNKHISVTLSTKGAEMQSINKGGKEILWDGNPEVWACHAPVLFPICGGLKDDKFVFEGKEYILQKHGYGRFEEFELEYSDPEKAVFLLRSNEESLKHFPFEYELRIIYTLDESKVNVEYNVKNLSKGDMYFSIGSHEGYACPEGIEEYSIMFDECEDLDSSILNGNLLEYKTINVGKNTHELPLKYEYFAVDALVFLNLKSRKVALKNRATGDMVEVDFNGADYLLLWTKPGANYICIEPWSGVPDFVDSDCDITHKKGITKLSANDTYVKKHSISV
ncbi:MAG: aldose 1-epimerase family protein [Clostridia bacterium]|nr:aldose 1-epimerase family protein [Clostridia bacterium]